MSVPFSLTPTAVVGSNAIAVIGGGTADAALASAGGSYVEFQSSGYLTLELSNVTIPAGARVVYVQPFFTAKRVTSTTTLRARLYQMTIGRAGGITVETFTVSGVSFTPILGAQQGVGLIQPVPGEAATQYRYWTQDDLNSLQLILDKPADGLLAHVDLAWVSGVYAVQPVVDVIGPASPVTDTTRPVVSWTWTPDAWYPDQLRYAVRVFSASQYSAGGFNPETSPATWEATTISTADQVQVGTHLTNGVSYRAYVRAAAWLPSSSSHWSEWDYAQFTLNLTLPPAPTVTAVADNANARIAVTVDTVASTPSTDYFTVERTIDGGATWVEVRDGTALVPAAVTWDATVYDYESPNGVAAGYRARAVSDDAGVELASAPSNTSTATWSSTSWWLKVPGAAALNTRLSFTRQGIPQPVRRRPQGRHDVVGRRTPVVTSDIRRAVEGEFTAVTTSAAARAALDLIFDADATCLLQSPLGAGWGSRYIELGDIAEQRAGGIDLEPTRYHRVPFVEVDAPA